MPEQIKLLIIEDYKPDQQTYLDAIKTLNLELEPDFEIVAIVKETKEEGAAAIASMKDELHAAFIDLKLTKGQPVDVNEGNDLIAEIYQKLRFPVVVLTNTPGSFNGDFKISLFLRVETKTDADYEAILRSVVDIYKTGISRILGRSGLIERMLDQIFWKNISNTLGEWLKIKNPEKPLLRYTLAHIQEHLEISDDGAEFDTVFPIENYIVPTIKDYFFTGDIIQKSAEKTTRYVILNPACDLAPHGPSKLPKATHLVLAEIQNFENTPFGTDIKRVKKLTSQSGSEEDIEKAKQGVFRTITNNGSPQYYYLPDTKSIQGGLINFQRITTVKYSDMTTYEVIATISSPFIKDIIAKFSFYFSRQGSPDFEFERLLAKHIA